MDCSDGLIVVPKHGAYAEGILTLTDNFLLNTSPKGCTVSSVIKGFQEIRLSLAVLTNKIDLLCQKVYRIVLNIPKIRAGEGEKRHRAYSICMGMMMWK